MPQSPLTFTFYIAAPVEKVWDGFVSKEANRTIFMGADFEVDLRSGGSMSWSGPGKDGKPTRYVTGRILRADPPRLLEYDFGMGVGETMSHSSSSSHPNPKPLKSSSSTMGGKKEILPTPRTLTDGRASSRA